jgi:hypothetical protein
MSELIDTRAITSSHNESWYAEELAWIVGPCTASWVDYPGRRSSDRLQVPWRARRETCD